MILRKTALLALADGSLFWGHALGATGETVGEVVFNTAMTGYQEILTDPSYFKQIVTLTYPHIGNVGVNSDDAESETIMAAGLVVRDVPPRPSNFRSKQSLQEYLTEQRCVAIAGLDTRRLTRILREKGAQDGCIVSGAHIDEQAAVQCARDFPGLKGMDLAQVVSTKQAYEWDQGSIDLVLGDTPRITQKSFHVVAYDYGIKHNILRKLVDRGCRVSVVPAKTPPQDVLNAKPDGVFFSNGPGDPEPCDYAIDAIKTIVDSGMPSFGICLGHQLLGLASGGRTVKMKFGHHGANHPVQALDSGRVLITSQNHGFAVDESTLPDNVKTTHRSLFDGSLQGIQRTDQPAFSFQGHPEASPGPHDVDHLFDQFVDAMRHNRD